MRSMPNEPRDNSTFALIQRLNSLFPANASPRRPKIYMSVLATLEFLLLMEEHAEADDGSVDQQSTDYGHDHGFNLDETGVRENNGEGYLESAYTM